MKKPCYKIKTTVGLCFIVTLFTVTINAQTPSFPGAGGGGAQSVGGRGGVVYEVTNLNDNGPGSLREGIEKSGPRTIVFRVGGTIRLLSGIKVTNPYITIAGQTAPGGGIQINGQGTRESILIILTHDVIIRYLRLRHGYNALADQTGDPVSVMAGHNVIIDHCTLMWTTDENCDAWGDRLYDAPHNITWSWNIFAEPLSAHPTNVITGSDISEVADKMTDIDLHHNLLANSSHRNPLIKNKTFRFVSNIVYNWQYYATMVATGTMADILMNLYRPGPLNQPDSPHKFEIEVFPESRFATEMPSGRPSIYVMGNKGPNNLIPGNDNWIMVTEIADENGDVTGPLSTSFRRIIPLPDLPVPIIADSPESLEKILLTSVGASHRLDCYGKWIPNRDSADQRIIREYHSFGGKIPVREDEVGGFPYIPGGTACEDTDHDGMPDIWEKRNRLDMYDQSDGSRIGATGYSNLEIYLSGTVN
ncbi:MAG: hypothetical protein IPN67_06140 [Bacteroidales bacterium]|nr:hypothetical protein [Bacteroidales bacterium]